MALKSVRLKKPVLEPFIVKLLILFIVGRFPFIELTLMLGKEGERKEDFFFFFFFFFLII